ncbi:MAG: hypothetical protein R6V57_08785 [Vicinamibacterales bacterium]
MSVIEARALAKSFWIPSARRETLREHALHLFTRRSFERLDVLRSVNVETMRGSWETMTTVWPRALSSR